MYSNSVTTGDWERFVAEDLVTFIDGRYRTLADRKSRGLAGHSMGGYGALRIGMKRPDVFLSLYIMSACCLTANRDPRPEAMAASEAIKTREQALEAARAPGFGPSTSLASAAAWSPNPNNPPLFLDLPVKDGKVRPEIVAKWVANAPLELIDQHASNLMKYYAISIDIGTKDSLLASNKRLHEAMTRLYITHYYEEYDGDHTNKVRQRIERNVLPFFAKNLVSPVNPTSPTPP
jgi:enterochelin esterase-like enzyme